jgi:uncharacterized membrane protein YkgB
MKYTCPLMMTLSNIRQGGLGNTSGMRVLLLSLVSISLLISRPSVRNAFFAGMLTFGGIGTYWLITAFIFVGGF